MAASLAAELAADEPAAWEAAGAAVESGGASGEPDRPVAAVASPCFVPPPFTSGAAVSVPGR